MLNAQGISLLYQQNLFFFRYIRSQCEQLKNKGYGQTGLYC